MPAHPQRPVEREGATSPVRDASAPPAETRKVQVVARWNSWVQVHDPSDGSLTWVDLSRQAFAPA
ncbi:MAG: hypothetical protein VX460_01785 [Planctomycetota bacterium]|nr:hypothetical protein [Planctomycetota bacterium]